MKHLFLNDVMFLFLPNFPAKIIEVQEGLARGWKESQKLTWDQNLDSLVKETRSSNNWILCVYSNANPYVAVIKLLNFPFKTLNINAKRYINDVI